MKLTDTRSPVTRLAGTSCRSQLSNSVTRPARTGIVTNGRSGAGASLRLDLSALLYPVRDRYTIPPVTVARSPIADLAAGIGLEVALGERIW